MPRKRKAEYRTPIEPIPYGVAGIKLVDASPAFRMSAEEWEEIAEAFAPPGSEYPMSHMPAPGQQNAYREWLIRVLLVLTDCYPHPINLAMDTLRKSLIEVERGVKANLFQPARKARRKSNFAAQEAANLAVLAANYIHDVCGNDEAYELILTNAGTSRLEIDSWRNGRIDPAYRTPAIVAWADYAGAQCVLANAIAGYRLAMQAGHIPQ